MGMRERSSQHRMYGILVETRALKRPFVRLSFSGYHFKFVTPRLGYQVSFTYGDCQCGRRLLYVGDASVLFMYVCMYVHVYYSIFSLFFSLVICVEAQVLFYMLCEDWDRCSWSRWP